MTKLAEKWTDFGTGAGQINSRSVPANFTPSNYTPAQISSEGNDKVSAHLNGLDTKVGNLGGASFTDTDFDVGGGGETDFTIAGDITPSSVIDVFLNGKLQREGGSNDYTRDSGTDTITFNFTVPENAWVRVRLFS